MFHRNGITLMAIVATTALIATASGSASGTPHVHAALIPTPHLKVTITHVGGPASGKSKMVVHGPTTVSAGRIAVSLHAVGGEAEVGFAKIKKGHTYKEVNQLFQTFESSFGPNGPSKKGLRALNKVVKLVTFYGGLDSGSKSRVHGTVVLPKAGTYLISNDSNEGPAKPTKLHVTARVGNRATPTTAGIAKATTAKRFRGSLTLPAVGTITFHNASTSSPHFFGLQHVAEGTTRKEVIKALNSDSQAPPPWARNANVGADILSPGGRQTISYHLPAGEYVEWCFFPDLQTGMPHAMMGMVRVVHLK